MRRGYLKYNQELVVLAKHEYQMPGEPEAVQIQPRATSPLESTVGVLFWQ
jgi:hypothetical protein